MVYGYYGGGLYSPYASGLWGVDPYINSCACAGVGVGLGFGLGLVYGPYALGYSGFGGGLGYGFGYY